MSALPAPDLVSGGGPLIQTYDTISIMGTTGMVLSAGVPATPTNSAISFNIDPLQGLLLMQGIPLVGPSIQMATPAGITLQGGPPMVGACIKVSPEALTLSWGTPGAGPSITLNATGITLSFAGANSVVLGPTGLTLTGVTINNV